MGGRKSLIARLDPQGGPATLSRKKSSLTPASVYADVNRYLGMVFKMAADFMDYHPAWLFPKGNARRRRKGRRTNPLW